MSVKYSKENLIRFGAYILRIFFPSFLSENSREYTKYCLHFLNDPTDDVLHELYARNGSELLKRSAKQCDAKKHAVCQIKNSVVIYAKIYPILFQR